MMRWLKRILMALAILAAVSGILWYLHALLSL
jgi:hypothetical protein